MGVKQLFLTSLICVSGPRGQWESTIFYVHIQRKNTNSLIYRSSCNSGEVAVAVSSVLMMPILLSWMPFSSVFDAVSLFLLFDFLESAFVFHSVMT